MAEALRACPFCGIDEAVATGDGCWIETVPADYGYQVKCGACGATGPTMKSREFAEKCWNTRAEPERHVLGTGKPSDWTGVIIGKNDDETGVVLAILDGDKSLDWPDNLNGRYRLELVKMEEES
jgi:hypothetical protein